MATFSTTARAATRRATTARTTPCGAAPAAAPTTAPAPGPAPNANSEHSGSNAPAASMPVGGVSHRGRSRVCRVWRRGRLRWGLLIEDLTSAICPRPRRCRRILGSCPRRWTRPEPCRDCSRRRVSRCPVPCARRGRWSAGARMCRGVGRRGCSWRSVSGAATGAVCGSQARWIAGGNRISTARWTLRRGRSHR